MFLLSIADWIANSFPVIRFVLLILMVIGSLFLIAVVLLQPGNSEGMGALGGSTNDSYLDKNKSNTLEGKLKKITVITAIALMVICVLFFTTVAIYAGV